MIVKPDKYPIEITHSKSKLRKGISLSSIRDARKIALRKVPLNQFIFWMYHTTVKTGNEMTFEIYIAKKCLYVSFNQTKKTPKGSPESVHFLDVSYTI